MICRVCDATDLTPAIDLGQHPWCNHFLKADEVGREPFYPLRVVHCGKCQTVQLDFTVKKEIMFSDHTYLSGVTKSLSDHFEGIAREVDRKFFADVQGKAVMDIGSNDGTQLKHYKALAWDVLGVESSKTTARIANDAGIATLNAFFDLDCAKKIGRKFHAINAAGVFFHLEDLHSVADGIQASLREDGVFVVQFLYMKRIVENLAFDQIYHEHLLYYNLRTLGTLLKRHGLEIFDAWLAPIHGGQMIALTGHPGHRKPSERLQALLRAEDETKANSLETYLDFAARIKVFKAQNLEYLKEKRAAGKRVWGLGAPVKGNTMLNYFGVGPDLIQCLVERNELRRGLFAPGSHIPIVIERELTEVPDVYYVLAWNFKKEILARNQDLIARGVEFYFPINAPGV